ncbi:MAG TPA: ATP-dependent helicase [Enteractinococcus helveticum]|uniref:DNA 3'-5' helicase n=1 Tax=Enteractinococcus helveticum TaxID=1837282 RepID=A0A921FLI0_9MICC|nr:ATP-dependent DNA helicase [Enteractinococcus helveticum]HJF14400.1 ATP-dependent helicase [Enteractinococcus helveticum]
MADLTWGHAPRYTARELTDLLEDHKPADKRLYPTDEQTAIIEAGPDPLLVVAGAGSGKTHTMTDRVIWLIANGYVRPEEVLGVTFTRKAAGELETRINTAIERLASREDIELDFDTTDIGQATVTTYHSYANTLVADHGLRIGVEPDSRLIGEAETHQLITEVVRDHDADIDLSDVDSEDLATSIADGVRDRPLSSTIKAVAKLAGDCAEHLVEPGQVKQALAEMFTFGQGLPEGKSTANTNSIFTSLKLRSKIADMVTDYLELKKTNNVMDYGDLVRYAALIATQLPEVRAIEREKYRIVLLDEFQDTSHAQLKLFSYLFGRGDGTQSSHSVTAVGDPNQSIYGFRGASAGQLFSFVEEFGAQQLVLTTAWRNSQGILDMANHVAQPLREEADAGHVIPELQARPGAASGTVELNWFSSADEEANHLAKRIQELDVADGTTTAAILCRTKKQFDPLIEALEARSISYEVVGLAGLLTIPEVIEIVAILKVLAEPQESDGLLRLLTNARWRIGPEDLWVLNQFARTLEYQTRNDPLDADTSALEDIDHPSMVSALLRLPKDNWVSSRGQTFSEDGFQRLHAVRLLISDLMRQIHLPIPTLIRHIENITGLGVEVGVRPGHQSVEARRYLDEFLRIAESFQASADQTRSLDLITFLTWLETAAEEEDGLDMPPEQPKPGAVQIMTMHASKGLEWDAVFVPGLTQNTFPGNKVDLWTSTSRGDLPWPLRGDCATLPSWDQQFAGDRREWAGLSGVDTLTTKMADELSETHGREVLSLKQKVQRHELEEARRLAYVAFTRAKDLLWVSGSYWAGTSSRPQTMSVFLEEMVAYDEHYGLNQKAHWAEEFPEENPRRAKALVAQWPFDPLDGPVHFQVEARDDGRLPEPTQASIQVHRSHPRRQVLTRAAQRVRHATGEPIQLDNDLAQRIDWVLDRANMPVTHDVPMPEHISTSRFVELAHNPDAVARQIRRPMPQRPTAAAREGTLVHEWIEHFYTKNRPGLTPMLDIEDTEILVDAEWDEVTGLAELREKFEASGWAEKTPVMIEAAVETSVAGLTLRGRIDAVFRHGGDPNIEFDPEAQWELVDWKTGRVPSDAEMPHRSLQLAIYRLAWSRLYGIPLENITGKFVYLAHGIEKTPQDFASAAQLEKLLAAAFGDED